MTDDRAEIARQSAHVLLDALSAFDDLSNPNPDPAVRTALARLAEIDAVTLRYDEETGTRTVDIQPVLHASLRLLASAVTLVLQRAPGADGVDVIQVLREAVDRG